MRNRDIVFLENQTIKDVEKDEKPKSINEIPINLNTKPPIVPHGDKGDKQEDDGEPIQNDVEVIPTNELP